MPLLLRATVAWTFLLACTLLADAAIVYDEGLPGMSDLSNDNMAPTDLGSFTPMVDIMGNPEGNGVAGTSDSGAADIFTFTIGQGLEWGGLFLTEFENGGVDNAFFVAVSAGDTFPSSYDDVNFPPPPDFLPDTSGWLGGSVIGIDDLTNSRNVLGRIGNTFGVGTGFTPPLGEGQYTVFVQQTGALTDYTLNFNVTAVPEPSAMLAIVGMTVAGYSARRVRNRRRRATADRV